MRQPCNSNILKVCTLGLLMLHLGCGTGAKRTMSGASIGAGTGAIGGLVFSPNDESRGLNSLVFGLVGAVAGGIIGALTDNNLSVADGPTTLKDRDMELESKMKLYQVESSPKLPAFVKSRLQPIIVEEYTNRDTVDEDGSLHEPHKVYRIKRNGELFPLPTTPSRRHAGKTK